MYHAQGYVGAMVLGEQDILVDALHLCRVGHHDAVLGAVVVHLYRERRPRVHRDALLTMVNGIERPQRR